MRHNCRMKSITEGTFARGCLRSCRPLMSTLAQRLGLHLQVDLGVDVRRVQGDVTKPCSNRIDVDASAKEVYRRRVPNRVRANALALHRLDLFSRLRCAGGHDSMDAEPRHWLTGSAAEHLVFESTRSHQWPKCIRGLGPQRTDPPLVALAENAHRWRGAELKTSGS